MTMFSQNELTTLREAATIMRRHELGSDLRDALGEEAI